MSNRPGWMSSDELAAIRTQASGARDVLEIGTYCGLSTEALLDATTGMVFTVDPFERGETVPPHPQQRAWIEPLVRDHPERLVVIPARSQDLIWSHPIDVLMVDGEHSYAACSADLESFGRYIRKGGILFLDDYIDPYLDVLKSWEDFSLQSDFEPLEQVGKLAMFRRTRVSTDERPQAPGE